MIKDITFTDKQKQVLKDLLDMGRNIIEIKLNYTDSLGSINYEHPYINVTLDCTNSENMSYLDITEYD